MISENELRKISILEGLTSEELGRIGGALQVRKVQRGSFILYAEDPGPSLMFIASGEVKITLLSDDGKEVVLALMQSGDFFGEIALLTGRNRSANVVAASDCELYVLSESEFETQLRENSGFALAMLKALAERLRAATAKIGHLALYDVYERVAKTLITLATPVEIDGKTVPVIEKRPTHQELAAMVGTSREMVTRALKGLEEDEFIRVDGKRLEILRQKLVR